MRTVVQRFPKWAVVGMAAGLAVGAAQALEPDALFGKIASSVWAVRTFDAQEHVLNNGSAVVVAPGRLVTNCHVLAKASSFVIRQDNVSYGATLEYPDVERDLCQISVANFRAAPVPISPPGSARVGQRVYAIGNSRGVENTLNEGMLSGLRGGDGRDEHLLQTTAPVSAGSSGGGLFDAEGRLLGILDFGAGDTDALNFAVPAEFIAEIPRRAQAAMAARSTGEPARDARRAGSRSGGMALTDPLRPGDALEYMLTDQLTGKQSRVMYRLDRISGDQLSFNMGGRIETRDGQVVSISAPAGGVFDSSSPPGGWARKDLRPGMHWHVDYVAPGGDKWRHELDAAVVDLRTAKVDGVELKVMQIDFKGWLYSAWGTSAAAISTPFEATALYAPALGRVVRFDVSYRRSFNIARESIELMHVLR
jgi:S1-C subfamily serine protease